MEAVMLVFAKIIEIKYKKKGKIAKPSYPFLYYFNFLLHVKIQTAVSTCFCQWPWRIIEISHNSNHIKQF